MNAHYKRGERVRAIIDDALVIEEVPLRKGGSILDLAYEGLDGEINKCTLPVEGSAITIERTAPTEQPSSIEGWRRPLPNPLAEMFAPGTQVRHLNPQFAGWRGVVTPDPENGRFLRSNDCSVFDPQCDEVGTSVRISWDHNTSWYGIDAIAPEDAPVEWPPQPGDTWDSKHGRWFAVGSGPVASHLVSWSGVAWPVEKVRETYSLLTLVRREEQDGGRP